MTNLYVSVYVNGTLMAQNSNLGQPYIALTEYWPSRFKGLSQKEIHPGINVPYGIRFETLDANCLVVIQYTDHGNECPEKACFVKSSHFVTFNFTPGRYSFVTDRVLNDFVIVLYTQFDQTYYYEYRARMLDEPMDRTPRLKQFQHIIYTCHQCGQTSNPKDEQILRGYVYVTSPCGKVINVNTPFLGNFMYDCCCGYIAGSCPIHANDQDNCNCCASHDDTRLMTTNDNYNLHYEISNNPRICDECFDKKIKEMYT